MLCYFQTEAWAVVKTVAYVVYSLLDGVAIFQADENLVDGPPDSSDVLNGISRDEKEAARFSSPLCLKRASMFLFFFHF